MIEDPMLVFIVCWIVAGVVVWIPQTLGWLWRSWRARAWQRFDRHAE